MNWRKVTRHEHDAVATLILALYDEDPAPTAMSRELAWRTLERLRAEPLRGCVVVHEFNGKIAAYGILCAYWSNELGGEVCIIDELYVIPEARGRGLATALVGGLAAASMPWFRTAVAIELEVTPNNQRARRLYEQLGFRPYRNAQMRLSRGSG